MTTVIATAIALCGAAQQASAQLVVSVNEGKVMLADGKIGSVGGQDTLVLIDLSGPTPKAGTPVEVPTSIVGPPMAVDVTPDRKLALATAGAKRDPANPQGPTVSNDTVSVIDLTTEPPKIVATLQAGQGAAGISINREGSLALVANRNEGTVSVLGIQGRTVTSLDKVALGDAKSGPSHVVFTPDGKHALVTRDGDNRISVLDIDGTKVKASGRDLYAGLRPYGLDISSNGEVAVVGNIGIGQGDADTVSLIDMTARPPRVVDTITVGQTPEGISLSADGRYIGVNTLNGTNKPHGSPFYNEAGKFVLLRVDGKRLVRVADAPIGAWSQGVAFSSDGHRVLIQNAVQKEIQVLAIDNEKISDTGVRLKLDAAPSSIRVVR